MRSRPSPSRGPAHTWSLAPTRCSWRWRGECLGEEAQEKVAFVPTLREGREEGDAIATAIAHAHASGAKLDWGAFFEGTGAKRVPLPTYPFQRKRYWLELSGGAGTPARSGRLPPTTRCWGRRELARTRAARA